MDWIQQWQSKLNKQNGVAPLVRTGGSRHTGLAALPYRNIHSFTKTRNRIVKRTGRDPVLSTPCRIRQTALPALSHQFHPFIQGTPWGTFVSHNETSMCSEFLSPINGME